MPKLPRRDRRFRLRRERQKSVQENEPNRGLKLEPLRVEPGESAETRAHSFIESLNAQNELGIGDAFPLPEPDPYFIQQQADPIGFLIDRVDQVIIESVQGGTEPLSTKASVLAMLYQARALNRIADEMQDLNRGIGELVDHLKSDGRSV